MHTDLGDGEVVLDVVGQRTADSGSILKLTAGKTSTSAAPLISMTGE